MTDDEQDMKNAALRLRKVVDTLHHRMDLGALLVFLELMKGHEFTQQGLAEELDVTQATISRRIGTLSNLGGDTLNLLEMREDPSDRRAKTLRLTAKGKRLARKIASIVLDRGV